MSLEPITFSQQLQPFKTSGIDQLEWRGLFTTSEPFYIDELRDNINNMTYTLTHNGVHLDDIATLVNQTVTYRQFLRTCFKAFDEAGSTGKGIDVNDILVYPSLVCFEALGLIAEGRKEVIIQGVPLN